MPNLTLTVRQYLDAPKPFPEGTSITIVDDGDRISNLTRDQIADLETNGVVLLDANINKITLNGSQFSSLGSVNISQDDIFEVTVSFNGVIDRSQFDAYVQKGVDIINADKSSYR